jgi:hypothetical protein
MEYGNSGNDMLSSAFLVITCTAQTQQQSSFRPQEAVKNFLQKYLNDDDANTRYVDAFVDLSGDGKQEVVIYFNRPEVVWHRRLSTFVLTPEGSSYRLLQRSWVPAARFGF